MTTTTTAKKRFADGPLGDLRVLELTDQKGQWVGKLMADFGADVLKIEPPRGAPERHIGPFYQDIPHLERSLHFWHYNTSKRGITLNLDAADGQALFKRLAARVDVVVETFTPGYLAGLGLGYEDLERANHGIILTSITPFGQTGPYAKYLGEELVGQASGGLLWMCGWPDRAPVMMGGGPAMHQASAQAAAGTLIALEAREQSGEGQQVDVSVQAGLPLTLMASMPEYYALGVLRQPRVGDFHGSAINGMFACSDGYADFRFRGRVGQWINLVEWLASEGMAEDLGEEQWRDNAFRRQPDNYRHIDDVFQRFIVRYTREDAMDLAQRKGIEVGAVYTAAEILSDPQLQARQFFVEVEHPELGKTFVYPGGPYTLTETPWQLRRRAPLLGEHNLEVFEGELGLTRAEVASFSAAGVI